MAATEELIDVVEGDLEASGVDWPKCGARRGLTVLVGFRMMPHGAMLLYDEASSLGRLWSREMAQPPPRGMCWHRNTISPFPRG